MSSTAAGYEFLTCYICGKTYLRATGHMCEPPPEIFKTPVAPLDEVSYWRARAEKAEADAAEWRNLNSVNKQAGMEWMERTDKARAELAALKSGLAHILAMLDRAHQPPGDIIEKRLNAENHARGAMIGLLNLLPLPDETREEWERRYSKALEKLQKARE